MRDKYQLDNDILYKSYLERTWFTSWRKPRGEDDNMLSSLEIFLTSDCNLGCTYCYLNRYENGLYPPEIREAEPILKNVSMLIDWLIENQFTPGIEFFSGSALESDLGLNAVNLLYDKYKNVDVSLRPPYITIPTNYTFILDDELTAKVEEIIEKIESLEIGIHLSTSSDGKYLEQHNRPFRNFERIMKAKSGLFRPEKDERDDEYYDKLFRFNLKYGFGFHPMVYSHKIELWKENFLWYQEMFEKFGVPFSEIYLLEVRNMEWSEDQLNHYNEFLDFLLKWTWEKVGKNKDKFFNFIFVERGYNIFTNSLYVKGRGTSCSLQTALYIRAGDLALIGCHRQSYDGYEFGKLVVENDKIVDIESGNVEFAMGIAQVDVRNAPYCESCALKEICMGSCLGASLEVTGDPFTPIPTVCELIHRKAVQIILTLTELGIYDDFVRVLDLPQKQAYDYMFKEIYR